MVKTSRKSLIGQQNQSSTGKCQPWYTNVLDLITSTAEYVHEEDVVIGIESSIFAIDIQVEQTNSPERGDNEYHHSWEWEERLEGKFGAAKHKDKEQANPGLSSPTTQTQHARKSKLQKFSLWEFCKTSSHNTHEEEYEESETDGLFGTEKAAPAWPLDRFFNNETSTAHQKKIVALVAWFLSFTGLVAALFFLTRDFVTSSRKSTSTIQLISSKHLELPKLWFCSADTQLPMFVDLPKIYKGQPLFWIDFLKGTRDGLNISFPDTRSLPQVDYTTIGTTGINCNASKLMNAEVFYRENYEKPSCFHCLSIMRTPALTIDQEADPKSALEGLQTHAFFRLSQQSFLSHCRMSQWGMRIDIQRFFREEIKRYSRELKEKGILNFNGLDPTDRNNDGLLFPFLRYGYHNTTVDFVVFDVVDMYCNVYMFSGFFYPSVPSDVRFTFNQYIFRWERTGNGPYYPKQFSEFYNSLGGPALTTVGDDIAFEDFRNRSMFLANALHVMTNASRKGGAETLAVLQPEEIATLAFTRTESKEREWYDTRVLTTKLQPGMTRTVNSVYFVDFRFESFFTNMVTEQKAMSWTAFLADILGLTSLFLDISVYTIIVSPISGRKAPGQQKSRKRASEKAKRALRVGYETGQ